ncbi:MerR family transcriptional regulator [Planotetraspora thailandica]|uniref:MerR family transcriptional regulator n=2 Tax=Planotetraspora thailandica TaxID=487172 RepID=A0A8J3V4R6_9ACTN|nr:MerR family transcriptional regulator [Planotetraspora thailandica]
MTIGEVAARTGLSVHTLRFYEREGILADPVRRDAGGRRVYTENDIEWLNLCVILRTSGMPVPEIRRYTELARQGDGTEGERLALLREHHARVTAQIGDLHRCLDLITYKIGIYEDFFDEAEREHAGALTP